MQAIHRMISQHLSNASTHNANDALHLARVELCAAVQRIDNCLSDTQSLAEAVEPHDPTGGGAGDIPQGRDPGPASRPAETRLDDMTIAELMAFAEDAGPPILIPKDVTIKARIKEVIEADLTLRTGSPG